MTNLSDFTMKAIDGTDLPLASLRGKVVLVVNVASKCGLTPQYEGLEALYEEGRDKGLVVLGVPANDFGAQEPGTDGEIAQFCETKFGVKFPMLSKVSVKGAGQHPLYQWLTTAIEPAGDVTWNFEKFLVDRDGNVVQRFSPKVAPASPEIREAVKRLLG